MLSVREEEAAERVEAEEQHAVEEAHAAEARRPCNAPNARLLSARRRNARQVVVVSAEEWRPGSRSAPKPLSDPQQVPTGPTQPTGQAASAPA
jgi:hypothetical protein